MRLLKINKCEEMVIAMCQNVITVINIVAIIAAPIISVVIAQKLQERAEKRKDKIQIFKTLMTSRIYGWTMDSVHALNIIDIVFSDDDSVRSAWKDLNDKYNVSDPDQHYLKKIEQAQYKLLEAMSNSLGYKGKITWETIQNPYIPNGLVKQMEAQRRSQQTYNDVLFGVSKMLPKEEK